MNNCDPVTEGVGIRLFYRPNFLLPPPPTDVPDADVVAVSPIASEPAAAAVVVFGVIVPDEGRTPAEDIEAAIPFVIS